MYNGTETQGVVCQSVPINPPPSPLPIPAWGAVSARSGQFLERRQTGLSGNAVEPLLAAHAAKVAIVLLALKIDEDDE